MWNAKTAMGTLLATGALFELCVFYLGASGDDRVIPFVFLAFALSIAVAIATVCSRKRGLGYSTVIAILVGFSAGALPMNFVASGFAFGIKTRLRIPSYEACIERLAQNAPRIGATTPSIPHPCRGIYSATIARQGDRVEAWVVIATYPRVVMIYSPDGAPVLLPGSKTHNGFGSKWYWHGTG